jgi:hypothetical protein
MCAMEGSAVAPILIDSMTGQSETLSTLSLAICGGIAALLLQVAIHNRSDGTKKLRLRASDLLLVAFVLEGASFVVAYLVRGSIVASVPELMNLKYDPQTALSPAASNGLQAIRTLELTQFTLLGLGILAILVVLIVNRPLIRQG